MNVALTLVVAYLNLKKKVLSKEDNQMEYQKQVNKKIIEEINKDIEECLESRLGNTEINIYNLENQINHYLDERKRERLLNNNIHVKLTTEDELCYINFYFKDKILDKMTIDQWSDFLNYHDDIYYLNILNNA